MDAAAKPGLCGCCETAASPTPEAVDNLPGLAAVAYRIGTYASFREAMVRALAKEPALATLTARTDDDVAITVLDLWAAVADVLTFYQERIANEAWLRTAVHRDSVLRMVRLLDYHLRPGLAATTRLAFTAETGAMVRIPAGLRVMSTPGQDERPQIFETVEAATADFRLNRLPVLPKPVVVNPLAQGRQTAFLTSDTAGWRAAKALSPKDKVVLFGGTDGPPVSPPGFTTLSEIAGLDVPDRVVPQRPLWSRPVELGAALAYWERHTFPLLEPVAPAAVPQAPEEKEVRDVRIDGDRFVLVWTQPVVKTVWTPTTAARIYRDRMRIFGHDAPQSYATVVPNSDPKQPPVWGSLDVPVATDPTLPLPLDRVYKDLAVGDELMIYEQGKDPVVLKVTGVSQGEEILGTLPSGSLADHRPRGTVTQLTLSATLSVTNRRKVQIYWLKGPALPLWTGDYSGLLTGGSVYVPAVSQNDDKSLVEIGRTISGKDLVPGIAIRPTDVAPGRQVLLLDHNGDPVAATVTECRVETFHGPDPSDLAQDQDFLRIDLSSLSDIQLETRTAVLLGNVAAATHGESVRGEILGDGNAAIPFQRFALRKSPLTYVPSARTVRGESALTLLANGERWQEVASLYAQPPTSRVFTARQAGDGTTVLQFGDGTSGARLPTGRGNVTATYRQGSGLAGRLAAEQLNILLDRPVGLKAAANPAPTSGGADPEVLDRARQAAPATVKTFGRIVSLLDFQLLALESGEIAKAWATWVWNGLEKGVHLTVAGQQGGIFTPEDLQRLYSGLTRQRDPNHPLELANFSRIPIVIEATITVGDDFVQADVRKAARDALLAAFAFDAVDFAAPVHLSDVYRILQDVPGVSFVDVDVLHSKGYESWTPAQLAARGATAGPVQPRLRMFAARPLAGSSAANDPLVLALFGAHPPKVLPAEQAFFADPAHDAVIGALGGLS
ncbi:MAG: putative baseplate assembly protein [Thermoanaerobaculia bacterium]